MMTSRKPPAPLLGEPEDVELATRIRSEAIRLVMKGDADTSDLELSLDIYEHQPYATDWIVAYHAGVFPGVDIDADICSAAAFDD
jgi:hypothetical protein